MPLTHSADTHLLRESPECCLPVLLSASSPNCQGAPQARPLPLPLGSPGCPAHTERLEWGTHCFCSQEKGEK